MTKDGEKLCNQARIPVAPCVYMLLEQVLLIDQVVSCLPGSSKSMLVKAAQRAFIVKCPCNPQGPNVLANELVASTLMRAIGLPVPDWHVAVFPSHLRCIHKRELGGCNLHFASRVADGGILYERLPAILRPYRRCERVDLGALLFDVWAGNTDSRQAVYIQPRCGAPIETFFIDHGHSFGGPRWLLSDTEHRIRVRTPDLFGLNLAMFEEWILKLRQTIPEELPLALQQIPAEWFSGDLKKLQVALEDRLQTLEELLEDLLSRNIASLTSQVRKLPKAANNFN